MSQTTPDSDFILDRHPVYSNVVIGAGFSGNAAGERVQWVRGREVGRIYPLVLPTSPPPPE